MENTQVYIDFLDGNLDYASEKEFAEKFAYDDDYRMDFKDFLNITRIIQNNNYSYGPSLAETSNIYSLLGYKLPITNPNHYSALSSSKIVPKNFINKNFLIGIMSSLATLFIVFVIGYFLNNSGYLMINDNIIPSKSFNNFVLEKNSTNQLKSGNIISEKKQPQKLIISKNNINNNQKMQKSNIIDATQTTNYIENAYFDDVFSLADFLNNSKEIATNNNHLMNHENNLIFNSDGNENDLFDIEIKNTLNWNLPKENIYPSELSKFNNLSISGIYNLSQSIGIGAEIRQETFYTKYNGSDSISQNFNYYQHPNFLTLGFFLRFSYNLSNNFNSLSQINIGINDYGVVSRGLIGLEYNFYNGLDFILHLEYSQLFFQHQSNLFDAKKIGLHYGLKFSL